jgi:hypothetical protein
MIFGTTKNYMRTLVFFLFLFLFLRITLHAQLSSAEAKAAYLLAEESYGKNDWKKTLSYLEECKRKLESTNCKILYLQIMAEVELSKTNPSYYDSVLHSIADFERSPDAKDFNEEKTIEVMKAKLLTKENKEKYFNDAMLKKEADAKAVIAFKTITWEGLPIGVSFNELVEKRKAARTPLFEHKTDNVKVVSIPGAKLIYDRSCHIFEWTEGCRGKGLRAAYVKQGIVLGYVGTLDYKSNSVGNLSRAAAAAAALRLPDQYSSLLGFQPVITDGSEKKMYKWEKDGKTVILEHNNLTISNVSWCVYSKLYVYDINTPVKD